MDVVESAGATDGEGRRIGLFGDFGGEVVGFVGGSGVCDAAAALMAFKSINGVPYFVSKVGTGVAGVSSSVRGGGKMAEMVSCDVSLDLFFFFPPRGVTEGGRGCGGTVGVGGGGNFGISRSELARGTRSGSCSILCEELLRRPVEADGAGGLSRGGGRGERKCWLGGEGRGGGGNAGAGRSRAEFIPEGSGGGGGRAPGKGGGGRRGTGPAPTVALRA